MKLRVGILGATGAVGQKFVRLLEGHPWFELTALAASERSAGKSYGEAAHWIESTPLPASVASMEVQLCEPGLDCDLVFSGLDSSVAGPVEKAFAAAGYPVISNAKNHRMDEDVPLLIPEVNPEHLRAIRVQQKRRGFTRGFVVAKPNCSLQSYLAPLHALDGTYGLEKVVVTTLQALSGAGHPTVKNPAVLAKHEIPARLVGKRNDDAAPKGAF